MKFAAMFLSVIFVFSLFTLCGCTEKLVLKSESSSAKLTAEYLRCEYLVNPPGIDEPSPRLSWVLLSSRRGEVQTAYRIIAAGTEENLGRNIGDLWDTDKVLSDQTSQIAYAGKPLKSGKQCFWKVMAWDGNDQPTAWSETGFWAMGLLSPRDWRGGWISLDVPLNDTETSVLKDSEWIWYPEGDPVKSAPVGARYFRINLTIPEGRVIDKAELTAAGDNQFVASVNGQEAGGGQNFKKPDVIDISKYLKAGKNVIAIKVNNVGDNPNPAGLIGMARIEFDGEAPLTTFSGSSWKVSDSEAEGWKGEDFDDSAWKNAISLGKAGIEPWGKLATRQLRLPPARFIRKNFNLDKAVKRATIYSTAMGLYELHINGQKVSDEYFRPGWTDYDTRVYYNTYDVTDLVEQGGNAIGSILADGWYVGYIGWGHEREHYKSEKPYFKAQLNVEYEDGTTEVIATDGTWKATTGPILEADFLMGETYDANLEMGGWSLCGFDDSNWENNTENDQIATSIEACPNVPVTVFKEIKPISITEPKPGSFVYDMGTNFAGFARLKVQGEKGTKVVLRFAERLNPDGTIYTTNLRGARTIDTYICKGEGTEIWQPRFTFHGFQYVELTGYPGKPDNDAITGIELTSATPVVGAFETSDKQANLLYRNIKQTQRANFIEIPTDCPQRDERLGWTGDAQIYVRTATYNTDVAAFFGKWLVDLEDAQLPDGAFPDVAPRKAALGGGVAAWGDAGVICPWTIYQVYGDERVLEKHYKAMARWINYCKGTTKGFIRPASGYGDWLSIKADTPKEVLATAYFANSTNLMSQIAEVLGKKGDAVKYKRLFSDIKSSFNNAFVGADGKIKGDTQTVYVLALAFGLVDGEQAELAKKHLADNIKGRDYHLSTGFVGTKDLMATLTAIDRADIAYRLFHNDTFPSWGFSIKHGATSIWERWDGWTPEKGFQDPGMNSFAHYSFGAVAEWMFKTIAGIDTDGVGYRNIIIKPQPGGKIVYAKASYNSINGVIATEWKFKGGNFYLDVTIPANTTATIYIPAAKTGKITESRKPADKAEGLEFLRMEGKTAIYKAGSGTFKFISSR